MKLCCFVPEVNLNFLEISDAGLAVLPPEIGNLTSLLNLVLKGKKSYFTRLRKGILCCM